ncbi:MAG: hypothetical protein E3J21_04670, partial [Anaerolineales bacterium]
MVAVGVSVTTTTADVAVVGATAGVLVAEGSGAAVIVGDAVSVGKMTAAIWVGVGVGVRVGTKPNSRRLGYSELGALARKLPRPGLSLITLLTALIICPIVANCEVIAAGIGLWVGRAVKGARVSTDIGNEVEAAVTPAEGEVSVGVTSMPGVKVLVGVTVGVGDETVGVVVGGDEAADMVVGGTVGVG